MGLTFYKAGDEDLVKGCIRADAYAQKRLYDLYSPKMYAICCRYLKDPMEAEDVLISAFTRILQKISQYKGEGSLEAWIKTIVIREALTSIRKSHGVWEQSLENAGFGPVEVSIDFQDPFHTEDLLKMIHGLPDGYRTVFNLYAIEGYSHKEIATMLHINENTSKSQLSRARACLKEMIAQQEQFKNNRTNDITAG
jgi:RNA polymerase sigma-70 factor (ECF subfamily)